MALPTPVGRQREVLYLPAQGHVVVLGTAGSGKTTLAILRAAYLADSCTDHSGKTLLVTFNRALVTYLKSLKGDDLTDVVVENYHTFARGYLAARGQLPYRAICDDDQREALVNRAVREVAKRHNNLPFFSRALSYFHDEIAWLAQHGIYSPDDHSAPEQPEELRGRTRSRSDLELLFEVYDEYRRQRTAIRKLYDWHDIATAVCVALANDDSPRRYHHVVIDEGQDFSPEMIRSLTLAVPSDGSVSFFGDVAQQIYGRRVSWRSAGLQSPRIWEFKENYRNTQQIAQLALAISQMPYYRDVPDLVEPVSPVAAGPLPTLVQFPTPATEMDFVVDQATRLAKTQSVAILLRHHRDQQLMQARLPRHAILLHRGMVTWQAGPGIRFGTYHSAKGLEFDAVILPGLSQDRFPAPAAITAFGEEGDAANNGRVLYVGVTRAKVRLIMTYTGQVTDLLPAAPHLYTRVVR